LDEKVSPTTTKRGLRKKNQYLVGPSTPGALPLVALRGLRKNSQYSHPSRDVEANVNEDAQDDRLSNTVGPTNDESRSDHVYADPEEDSDKSSSENMVEASLVEDREETPIATAEVVDTQAIEKAANRRRRTVYVLVAMLVAVVFGVVLSLRGNDNGSASSNGDVRGTDSEISNGDSSAKPLTLAPQNFSSVGLDVLLQNLPNDTLVSLQNASSPQSQAWDWLEGHKNVSNFEEWRKVQLFALATFYFSFQGQLWAPEYSGWLDETKDECQWMPFLSFEAFGNMRKLQQENPDPFSVLV